MAPLPGKTMSRDHTGASLWSADDFLRWLALFVVGGGLLIAGWWMASGTGHINSQIGPATLAVGGGIVASVAHLLWVLRGRRAIGERLDSLAGTEWLDHILSAPERPETELMSSGALVAAEGSQLFHAQVCPLVQGRNWPMSDRAAQIAAGRRPCGVCSP